MSRSGASARAQVGPPPAWILLDMDVVLADRRNSTTASALTSTGQAIHVTLVAADPPRDSYLCVHVTDGRDPRILHSVGDVALLSVSVRLLANTTDLFVYRVARRASSLQLLQVQDILLDPCSPFCRATFGILPSGEHFVVAGVTPNRDPGRGSYRLDIFRSDQGAWATTTAVELGSEVCGLRNLDKVVALGGGELGWVDLRKGILVCDVRAIPLPNLLPTTRFNLWRPCEQDRPAREYRDVAVCAADGSIRCVEMEHQLRRSLPELPDVSADDVLHDSDLPMGRDTDGSGWPWVEYEYLGWRLVTWRRAASSDCWRKESVVHFADDILAGDHSHTSLLLRDMGVPGDEPALTVASLMDVPSLGVDGGDVVYIMAKVTEKTWVVAVDMRRKTLAEVAPISVERHGCLRSNYLSCGLSRYAQTD